MQRANGTSDHQETVTGQPTSEENNRLVLTPEQRARLARNSGMGIVRVLLAQAVMALVVVIVSWGVAGVNAALSALAGAGVYFIPNTLFALRLLLGLLGGKEATPTAFFVGEFFKLGSALCLLALVVWKGTDWLVWPALLFGLLGVLKGYVLLLALRKLP